LNTILLPDYTGAMGHRLGVGIHMLAAACEYKFRLINLALLPYRALFTGLGKGPWGAFPESPFPFPHAGRLLRLFRKPLASWARRYPGHPLRWRYPLKMLDLGSHHFTQLLEPPGWFVFWGDQFRSDELVRKHQDTIRDFFRLPQAMRAKGESLLRPKPTPPSKTVLVHVRQGDYATWAGGVYCYRDSVYAGWMREIQRQTHPEKVRFVICSQFQLDYSAFADLDFVHQTRDLKDDFAMIQCADYCLASISSFARTACFLAQIPLAAMDSQQAPLPPLADWRPPPRV
jgi:hypothetical protein